jgi:hypothetical protein
MQVAMVSEEEDLMAKAMEPPDGKALVYIIRPSNLGKPFKFEVNCDGVYIGGTAGMLYIYVIVDPGEHLFVGISENTSELEISVEAGKIYYIRQRPMIGLFKGTNKLILETDEIGRKMLLECTLSADHPVKQL